MRVAVTSCPLSAAALHECLIDLVVTVSPRSRAPAAARRVGLVNEQVRSILRVGL